MTNNPVDAEDLTIEAFGKAFKHLQQYTLEYAFSTWLFRIAANNCIDYLRKRNRIQYTSEINPGEKNRKGFASNLPSPNPGPEEIIIAKQKIKLMREVVEKLKPHYRMLVEMRYFRELSYEEIAVELDLPLGTVKAKLFRARDFSITFSRVPKKRYNTLFNKYFHPMDLHEFQNCILQGIPESLPSPQDYDIEVNHAPVRKDILTSEQKRLALRNALRYFDKKHHSILAPEFANQLKMYGRIYMYRFRPAYAM